MKCIPLLLLLIFFLPAYSSYAQEDAIERGDEAVADEKYAEAINEYLTALSESNDDYEKKLEIQEKISEVIVKVDELRKKAEKNERELERRKKSLEREIRAKKQAIDDKEEAIKKLKITNSKLKLAINKSDQLLNDKVKAIEEKEKAYKKANKFVNSFYFYSDQYALTYKAEKFYFINKEGNRIVKLKKWDKAEQFDNSGFAKVISNGKNLLLDTLGNTYPFTTRPGKLKPNITALILSGENRKKIPKKVFNNPQLKVLILNDNQINQLPVDILKLKNLRYLDLSGNEITEFPDQIGVLKKLRVLNLERNNIKAAPEQIGLLTELRLLNFGQNQLETLPHKIKALDNLQYLLIADNKLNGTLLPEIGALNNLEILDLSKNKINRFPPEIGNLKKLKTLKASRNRLDELPESFVMLQNIQQLDLQDNRLNNFPEVISNLCNLELLDLSHNKNLSKVSPQIKDLEQLQMLDLTSTPISAAEQMVIRNYAPWSDIIFTEVEFSASMMETGQRYFHNNDFYKALKAFLLEIDQNDTAESYNWVALCYRALGEYDKAKEYFNRYLEKEPNSLLTHRQLILTHQIAEEYEEAYIWAQKTTKLNDATDEDWLALSHCALLIKQNDEALNAAQKAHQLNPDAYSTESKIALCYLMKGDWRRAKSLYQKWKGRVFYDTQQVCNDVFLEDINKLEQAGIDIDLRDIEKARRYLLE